MIDVMLDIETLGTRVDSVIMSVAAVKFNPKTGWIGDKQQWLLDVDQQLKVLNRSFDEKTIEWWSKQDSSVMESLFSENQDGSRVSIQTFASDFKKFMNGSDSIWAHGVAFDIAMIEHLLVSVGHAAPWSYGKVKDTRTLYEIFGDHRSKDRTGAHDALNDCVYQIHALVSLYEKFTKANLI